MHLLVMRFSAIGDVALSAPVLQAFTNQYPNVKVTVISREQFRPFFEPLAVDFISADLRGVHKGFAGVQKLFTDLKSDYDFNKVIDLHGVLRTFHLGALFRTSGTPVFRIEKGRSDKRKLTRKKRKVRKELQHTTQRYCDVFEKAGYPLTFDTENPPLPDYQSKVADDFWAQNNTGKEVVGIAPASSFPGKSWPTEKMAELMQKLETDGKRMILFGGPADKDTLEKLRARNPKVINLAGQYGFGDELAIMRKLKLMISMDSSNMHLAAMAGIPVVSIWGATHPDAGFGPLGDNTDLIAQIPVEELKCRPCSVYGKKPCFRKDYACMNWLNTDAVYQKVQEALNGA